ncbi:fimbrial protein [Pectobacterium polaris]|uniref:fimbrial protein n=1 Tax=Pectobacterium polaris TaxID=2042057 RepID=UPI0020C5F232|nr:fimbrial protein [Pectobacterium polaris]MDE8742552.1 fimbrial protein [Pectobacterium polaris]
MNHLKAHRYGDWHDSTITLTDCNLDTDQNVTIRFSARIEKIRDDLIQSGDFMATANFTLSYL